MQIWAGVSPVPVQVRRRGEPSPGADVGGVSPGSVQMWAGVSPVHVFMYSAGGGGAEGRWKEVVETAGRCVCVLGGSTWNAV